MYQELPYSIVERRRNQMHTFKLAKRTKIPPTFSKSQPDKLYIYSLGSYEEHSSFTVFFHCSLSWAWCSIWVHRRPICRSSCSADLLQLFFGLPQFLFPWGFQKSACLVTLLCGFLSVWPIHFHFFLLIWTFILSSWVFAHRSSLLIVFGHLTPRM